MGRKRKKLRHDPLTYGQAMSNILGAQTGVMEDYLAAEGKYGDQASQMYMDRLGKFTPQFMDILETGAQRMGDMYRDQQGMDRSANINAIRNLGPEAMSAFASADPRQMNLSNLVMDQATEDVQNRGRLGNIDSRNLSQNARSIRAAAGLGYGPSDVAYEVGEMQQGGERRRQTALQNALMAQTMRQQLYGNPITSWLNQSSGANPATAMGAIAQGSQYTVDSLFNPQDPTGMQIEYGNRRDKMAIDQANERIKAQNRADKWNMIGNIGGTAIKAASLFCWVAREVYGPSNPRWLLFREWMLTDSPRWLFNLYAKHGEQFANWLKNHTWLKPLIRKWMDSKIKD
jgi:hypothetical protein